MATSVVNPAESATATPTPNFDPSTYTAEEHSAWMAKGTVPTTSKPAESTPATEDQQAGAEQSAEPDAESAAAAQPSQQEQKGKGAEARKAQLAAEIQDLLKRRAELKAEVEGKKPDVTAEPSTAKPTKLEKPAKPSFGQSGHENETWEQFEARQDAYTEALAEYKAKAVLQADREETQRRREQETVAEKNREIEQAWNSRVEAAKSKYADFAEVAFSKDVPISPVMDAWILKRPGGVEVLYQLGKNPELAKQIAGMDAFDAAFELAQIERSVSGGAAAESPKSPVQPITKAARPATDLRATQAAPVDELKAAIEAGDTAAYMEIMNRRDVERRRTRR